MFFQILVGGGVQVRGIPNPLNGFLWFPNFPQGSPTNPIGFPEKTLPLDRDPLFQEADLSQNNIYKRTYGPTKFHTENIDYSVNIDT